MLYYFKRYPFSILVLLMVIYLSFFKPPSLNVPLFEGFDKFVHFCMYGGVSGVLWIEYLWNHRREKISLKRGMIGATICPIVFGGIMELGQQYLTMYRSGDWFDFMANSLGVLTATLIAWYILRPWIVKRFAKESNKR